jgi:hypothetical protein
MPGAAVAQIEVKVNGLAKAPGVVKEELEAAIKGITLSGGETVEVEDFTIEEESAEH